MIKFDHVTYTYPEGDSPALRDVSLELPEGEFILVVGASGAGKSTLLRCINGLVPHFSGGALQGQIMVHGQNPVLATPKIMSRYVGFVFQDPEAQFVMDRVEDELAFALENAALPRQEMRVRVEEVLDLLDLALLRDRHLDTLSGGEKQRVAIAAALALRPQILVLDEPTSQLDPKSAEDVLHALARLNADLGLTVVVAEHRLERVLPFTDLLVYLPDNGGGVKVGEPGEILPDMLLLPPLVELGKVLDWNPLPLTIKEGRRFSRSISVKKTGIPSAGHNHNGTLPYIAVRGLNLAYNGTAVVKGLDLELYPGEILALMGRNGAGKSTLLKSLVGLVSVKQGRVQVAGADIAGREVADICRQVGYLPQDPNALLFADTVMDELLITLRNHNIAVDSAPFPPVALLDQLGIGPKAGAYPRDLSAGERQRVALGALMVTRPRALLLDEPTRGLDYVAKRRLLQLLKAWQDEDMAILLVTHDVELAAAAASRVALMSQGEIIALGEPAEVLSTSPLFAPQVARLFPGSGWLTVDDALNGLRA
ncbi:MAG: ATP-binding cassette domain-containing protein [Anaerolineae bacterium]|nr:ATP-binding cassette domain-containing protein [Anaerolineae bacterium]